MPIKKGPRSRDLETTVTGAELNVSSWFLSSDGTNKTATLLAPANTKGFISASWDPNLNVFDFHLDSTYFQQNPSIVQTAFVHATGSALNASLDFKIRSVDLTASIGHNIGGGMFQLSGSATSGAMSGSFTPGPFNGTLSLLIFGKTRGGR